MHRFFYALYQRISVHKRLSVFAGILVLLVFGFFASQLKFEEDITKLIPMGADKDITSKVLKQMNFADKITVILESEKSASPEDLQQAAAVFDSLAQKDVAQYLSKFQTKMPEEELSQTLDFVYENLPLFLEPDDYKIIEQRLQSDSIRKTIGENYRSFMSPSGMITAPYLRRDPLGLTFLGVQKLQQMQLGSDFVLENGYIMTKDKKQLLLFLSPKQSSSETQQNKELSQALYQIKAQMGKEFGQKVGVHYFGSALIAVANADIIKQDILFTTLLAMTTLMIILMLFYRKIWIPIIIFLPTVFGALFALSVLFFVKQTISAISIGIGAILVGITIDYSLHILTHAKNNPDIKHLYKDVTQPLFMSSATTAIAFLCLLFVQSEALQDLGIFAAAIVMSSAFFSLVLIPHLYKPKDIASQSRANFIDSWANFAFDKSKILTVICLILVIVSAFTASWVKFDNDLSKLNYIPKDIQKAENLLDKNSSLTSKTIYLAAYGKSVNEALQANRTLHFRLKELQDQGKIIGYSSVGNVVLDHYSQKLRLDRWKNFWENHSIENIKSTFVEKGEEFGLKATTYEPFFDVFNTKYSILKPEDYGKLNAIPVSEFIGKSLDLATISTIVKVENDQREFLMKDMQGQVSIIPIDRQQLNESFLLQLRDDFNSLVNYSFIAVIAILFVFFRKAGLVILATIPIALTGLVTAGLMGIFGLELNIFSTIVCTLIFGHGVDFSIFMTSALQKEYTDGRNQMRLYRTSILLAAITTILGVGALIFARHPSLYSISSVSLIGVFAAITMTFVLYPVLFRFALFARAKSGKSPLRVRRTLHSLLSFTYYGIAGFLASMLTILVMKLAPISKEKKLNFFHWLMSKYMNSVFWVYPQAKHTKLNPTNETFDKPAIIVANHASALDVLAIGGLYKKVVFLVSEKVIKSPAIGKGVELAGFYAVSNGLDNGLEHLREKVNQGYSLVIFPEGTRSPDNYIRRFHKGAFFLAEEFQLDIVPMLLHGYSETAPKGDIILNPNPMVIEVLKRIPFGDTNYGNDVTSKTKGIMNMMRDKHLEMRRRFEGPEYFKRTLLESFDYKEEEVVQSVKKDVKLQLNDYFSLFDELGPKDIIAHFAKDYGQLDVLLALQHPMRKIYSFVEDEHKRAVAQQNYFTKIRNIYYLDQQIANFEKYNAVILSYWPENLNLDSLPKKVILNNLNSHLETFYSLGYSLKSQSGVIAILEHEGKL